MAPLDRLVSSHGVKAGGKGISNIEQGMSNIEVDSRFRGNDEGGVVIYY